MLKMKLFITLLLIIAGILVLTQIANVSSADTIIVAQDGNGNYTNIQDAIDNATKGDTIRVYEGTYYENPGENVQGIPPTARWLQYRATFVSLYGCASPQLREVRIHLQTTG